jgi:exodeoxyribonuclease V alpha subunit
MFYLPEIKLLEDELAFMLTRYIKSNETRETKEIQEVTDNLSEDQSRAVTNACQKNISLIRGYAGTGKSTVIKRIILSFIKAGLRGAVFCPTAKAAKRVQEILYAKDDMGNGENDSETIQPHQVKISTIHMGLRPKVIDGQFSFNHNENNLLDYDYIIIDEAPMGGLFILNRLLRSINQNKTKLILTGDENQLPSVDIGNVFYDLIGLEKLPQIYLNQIFRQGKNSGIVQNAARVLKGENLLTHDPNTNEKFEDINLFSIDDDKLMRNKIIELVCDYLPMSKQYNPLTDIQALSPGKKGSVGTKELNEILRERLNNNNPSKVNKLFKIGDKVINRRNMYNLNLVNGDTGIVKHVTKGEVTIDFGQGTGSDMTGLIKFDNTELDSIYLSYCYTVHSSQGSQYKAVVFPITSSHWILLYRNLLYTAMTRSIENLSIVYQKKSISKCIKTEVTSKRKSGLRNSILKNL